MPSNYFENYGVISLTSATVSITDEGYLGSRIILNRAAGITVTMPAATGSGNRYEFIVGTALSGANYVIAALGTDIMAGHAILSQDSADTVVMFETAADTDKITMSGTATGGVRGARIVLDDIASGVWAVQMISNASGSEATPFGNT